MPCSEKRRLHDAGSDPRAATRAKKHSQPLKEKSSKHEFLIKAGSDQRIENAIHSQFEVPLDGLEPAQIAAVSCFFGKIHRRENKSGGEKADDHRPPPVLGSFQPDVCEPFPAQANQ